MKQSSPLHYRKSEQEVGLVLCSLPARLRFSLLMSETKEEFVGRCFVFRLVFPLTISMPCEVLLDMFFPFFFLKDSVGGFLVYSLNCFIVVKRIWWDQLKLSEVQEHCQLLEQEYDIQHHILPPPYWDQAVFICYAVREAGFVHPLKAHFSKAPKLQALPFTTTSLAPFHLIVIISIHCTAIQ